MSLVSVLGTIITAFMVQMFGILLQASGYSADAAVQSSRTVFFLDLEYILIPGFLMAAAAVVLHFLPINKQRFESLKKAIALREEGGDYSMYMDDVKKILG